MSAIDIVGMPVSDRLKLMETLWNSLCAHSDTSMELPTWHGEVLEERLRRLASGEETVTPWKEAKERIRAQTKGG